VELEDIMNTKHLAMVVAATSIVAVASVASAQEKDANVTSSKSDVLKPAKNAVELTVATGYAQGFGDIGTNRPTLNDVGLAGGAAQIGVGYRLIPHLSLGIYGSGAMFSRGDQVDNSTNLYSAAAGAEATWHFLPSGSEFAPWVSLGTGWRGYWLHDDRGTTALHGLEMGKLQLGVDYRMTSAVAISPVVGGDLSIFLTESNPGSRSFSNITDPKVNSFVFAGVLGRFDIPTSADAQVASR
jgi:hypothetical protein